VAVERLPERASFWRPSADVACKWFRQSPCCWAGHGKVGVTRDTVVGPPGIYMFVSGSATSNTLHDESRRTETTTTSLAQPPPPPTHFHCPSSARGEPLLASRE